MVLFGLLLFGNLLFMLAEPFRKISWQFGHEKIEHHTSWLVFKKTRTHWIEGHNRVKVHQDSEGRTNLFQMYQSEKDKGPKSKVSLIDKRNKEICAIRNLTEGEALWITDVIQNGHPDWFR